METTNSYLYESHEDDYLLEYDPHQRMLRSRSRRPICSVQPVCSGETACQYNCKCISWVTPGVGLGLVVLGVCAIIGLVALYKLYIRPRKLAAHLKLSAVNTTDIPQQDEVGERSTEENPDFRQEKYMKQEDEPNLSSTDRDTAF